jgi:hypothetical protein
MQKTSRGEFTAAAHAAIRKAVSINEAWISARRDIALTAERCLTAIQIGSR